MVDSGPCYHPLRVIQNRSSTWSQNEKLKVMKIAAERRSFTSFQMVHTHTHIHALSWYVLQSLESALRRTHLQKEINQTSFSRSVLSISCLSHWIFCSLPDVARKRRLLFVEAPLQVPSAHKTVEIFQKSWCSNFTFYTGRAWIRRYQEHAWIFSCCTRIPSGSLLDHYSTNCINMSEYQQDIL